MPETVNPIDESTASNAPAEAEIESEVQKALEKASEILKKNSGRIQFDQKKAKASFQGISSILERDDDPSRKFTKEDAAKIKEIGDEATDCGLKIFASVTAKVLGFDEVEDSDKSTITNNLKTNFAFLGEDDYAGKNGEEISRLIINAVKETTRSHKDNKDAVDAINSGFQEAFPAEEERAATEKYNIMPGALKGATALTLALAVPPPLGVILALGFLAYTWNMGHEPEEKKPEIFNDPDVQKYAEAWKKFMKPPELEVTAENVKRFKDNPSASFTGGAAYKFAAKAKEDFKEGKKELENTVKFLKTAAREESEKELVPERSSSALEGRKLVTGGTGGEELQELMNRLPVAASEEKVSSETCFAKFVNEQVGELSKEELKLVANSTDVTSAKDLENALEITSSPAKAIEEANAVVKELSAASLEKATSRKEEETPPQKRVGQGNDTGPRR